jgi:FkbM family methyltransferase
MLITSFVYRRVLYGNRVSKRLWNMIRRLIIKINDETPCNMRVHGLGLVMPLSHALPLYLHKFPFYDRLPARLAKFIRAKLNSVNGIDVGANVGDTIAAFKEQLGVEKNADADTFIAIEPNPRFRKYLDSNWGDDQSVVILPYICSSSEGLTTACFAELNGTASANLSGFIEDDQEGFEKRTVDSIVNQYKERGNFNLLKIDTDGHDFEVIAGAKDFIKEDQPFLYFEVDAFSNPNFVEDCLNTLEFLQETGYAKVFVYDNFGNFMGLFEVVNILCIKNLLLYKLSKKSYYFDFLLMKDQFVDEFYKLEIEYFVNEIKDTRLYQAA